MWLIAFCEAPADFRISSDLADRVLRSSGPPWVGDVMDVAPEGVREWHADGLGRTFFDVHHLNHYRSALGMGIRRLGHFNGRPGASGALMARNVFQIVRHLIKLGTTIDVVFLVWDLDDEPEARLKGLSQARDEARSSATFGIVLGCPNAMREAWVLAGFVAKNADEEARLAALRRDLGFHPTDEAHLLDATDEQAKRSAKRVLRALSLDDRDREEACWIETPLDVLKARGADNGLADYLDQIERLIVPLCIKPAK